MVVLGVEWEREAPMKQASYRKNGNFGFKALVKYADGRTLVPISKNFETKDDAIAYAQKWIDANNNRPIGVRSEKVNVMQNRGN